MIYENFSLGKALLWVLILLLMLRVSSNIVRPGVCSLGQGKFFSPVPNVSVSRLPPATTRQFLEEFRHEI